MRSIVEMRSALAPDIARRAAERARPAQLDGARSAWSRRWRAAPADLPALQALAIDFWSQLVDASDNLAYRLAYNSLRATYDQCRELFTHVLADEIGDLRRYRAIAAAVRAAQSPTPPRRRARDADPSAASAASPAALHQLERQQRSSR